jgi:Mg-chelatase subunit ChlD
MTLHPEIAAPDIASAGTHRRRDWTRQTSAWLISIAFHALLLAIFAMVTWVVVHEPTSEVLVGLGGGGGGSGSGGDRGAGTGGTGAAGPGGGTPPDASAPAPPALSVPAPALPAPPVSESFQNPTAPDPSSAAARASDSTLSGTFDPALSALAGAGGGIPGFGSPGRGGPGGGGGLGSGYGPGTGSGTGPGLGGVLDDMRSRGLDVVFVLDATDSMAPYIGQGKQRLRQIISLVTHLVGTSGKSSRLPTVRFGLVAFKDYGDDYGVGATKSLPLTGEVNQLQTAMDQIVAGGGGDIPEPIHDALRAATDARAIGWNRSRKNVIVLVTDAPVHSVGREQAYEQARNFARSLNGQVNVIDVGGMADGKRMRETVREDLQRIAQEGNGSAFLLEDDREFWRHLIVSVFGRRYEQDVQQLVDKYVKQDK